MRIKIRMIVWIIVNKTWQRLQRICWLKRKVWVLVHLWLGVYPNEARYLALNQYFKLPKGIVPMWMISFGYIDQEEVVKDKFDSSKVHYEKY